MKEVYGNVETEEFERNPGVVRFLSVRRRGLFFYPSPETDVGGRGRSRRPFLQRTLDFP